MKRYASTLLLCVTWAFLLVGCGEAKKAADGPKAEARPEAKKKPDAPEVPQEFGDLATVGTTEVLVKDPELAKARKIEETYVCDPECACGTVAGICIFDEPTKPAPKPELLDPGKGPYAIPNPTQGEVEYYRNAKLNAPQDAVAWEAHAWGAREREKSAPANVVLRFLDVRAGRRPALMPTGYMSIHGGMRALDGSYGERTAVSFAPPNQRVTFFTWEEYPSDFVLTQKSTGKEVFQCHVSYHDTGREKTMTATPDAKIWIASHPNSVQSDVLKDLGIYEVTTRRHPWKFGTLFIVDNPYVSVTTGKFVIPAVPVGRHKMEVWHRTFEPVEKVMEFEVKKEETTEIVVKFKTPADLKAEAKTK